ENVKDCHKEMADAVLSQIELVKETMYVQEEILALCFNEEERLNV
ncbi:hypothetical protein A2U01_0091417, partial [Trifolium medium]|nr:hypothetical protein [Trifolium medium]